MSRETEWLLEKQFMIAKKMTGNQGVNSTKNYSWDPRLWITRRFRVRHSECYIWRCSLLFVVVLLTEEWLFEQEIPRLALLASSIIIMRDKRCINDLKDNNTASIQFCRITVYFIMMSLLLLHYCHYQCHRPFCEAFFMPDRTWWANNLCLITHSRIVLSRG